VAAEWLGTTWAAAGLVVVSTVGVYLAVLVCTRLAGLRSFAKISAFDFAMTVAIGSLVASVAVTRTTRLLNGLIALATLFLLQAGVALARRNRLVHRVVDNDPLLLMAGPQMLGDALRRSRVTPDDIRSKLRQQGLRSFDEVAAVVLETTGDISVIKTDEGVEIDPDLFQGVQRAEALQLVGSETRAR